MIITKILTSKKDVGEWALKNWCTITKYCKPKNVSMYKELCGHIFHVIVVVFAQQSLTDILPAGGFIPSWHVSDQLYHC